ncbi:diguanylate cyclase [Yoonia sediminilitoris]|nr:diguanylate cyclase [Yoonia sediminilitoris]
MQILDAVEQGVVIWSSDGRCVMHNQRFLNILELEPSKLRVGMPLDRFMRQERDRGVFSSEMVAEYQELFQVGRGFQFDFSLPSGEIISANVRPVREGGHVVAVTNVTETRQAITALNLAKAEAEEAERKTSAILEHERARQRETSLLANMDEWLQSCKSLEELYVIVSAFMQKALPGTRGQLFIYAKARDVLELACTWHCKNTQEQVSPDSCWALRRGRSYIYDPTELSFVCDHVKDGNDSDVGAHRFICVPIMAHGDTVGMMHVGFVTEGANIEVFDAVTFTNRCAEHISMAIANVKLRDELQDQSTRDPLTGLYNRRYFLEALRKELNQAALRQGNFALLSLDADHFKNFNDQYGHDAGDVVLEAIAEKMTALEFERVIPCRIGGEEFSLLLPSADRTRATDVAEELRQSIENARIKYAGGALPKVTVSIGVAVYPTHGTEPQDLIKQADVALYNAKKSGRNRWSICDATDLITFD